MSRSAEASAKTREYRLRQYVSPEFFDIAADHATFAEIDQALKHDEGSSLGHGRQSGLPGRNIDRGAGHHELADLGWESSGIDQR